MMSSSHCDTVKTFYVVSLKFTLVCVQIMSFQLRIQSSTPRMSWVLQIKGYVYPHALKCYSITQQIKNI